jgi:UDP-glucose 6-dehydrogenase
LGYVGQILSIALTESGFHVLGIEKNKKIVNKLKLNFSSFEHEASFRYMEDSTGKSSEWYLTEKDYDNSKLLIGRVSKKKYNQIKHFEGYEYIRNDLESHDHPQSVRFFIMITHMIFLKRFIKVKKVF